MHPHTVGHVDTHCVNVAVHLCTQIDKVTIGPGCSPINFPLHPFMACVFFFFSFFWMAWVLSGAAVVEFTYPGPGTAGPLPTVH